MELHKFRNYLEDIQYPKRLDKNSTKVSLRIRNVQQKSYENENSQVR
jgi:hypothetical protein